MRFFKERSRTMAKEGAKTVEGRGDTPERVGISSRIARAAANYLETLVPITAFGFGMRFFKERSRTMAKEGAKTVEGRGDTPERVGISSRIARAAANYLETLSDMFKAEDWVLSGERRRNP
ncbi:hypothetical protein ACLB2K_063328 [Fragaria x ananassa]